MPLSKTKRYVASNGMLSHHECYNPFPDLYQSPFMKTCQGPTPTTKPPFKKSRKCMQLVLICQKLLKPFGTTSTKTVVDKTKSKVRLEKSKSAHQINCFESSKNHHHQKQQQTPPAVPKPVLRQKIDASCQTDPEPEEVAESPLQKVNLEPANETSPAKEVTLASGSNFWDLDIDSAIVGDFNSVSEMSLDDERVDPLYSTIKFTEDGLYYKQLAPSSTEPPDWWNTTMLSPGGNGCDKDISNSSSPKSGVYSSIVKKHQRKLLLPPAVSFTSSSGLHKSAEMLQKKKVHHQLQPKFGFHYPPEFGTKYEMNKLNFDNIMRIRSQLGLAPDVRQQPMQQQPPHPTEPATPTVPKRNYGSSIINLIKKYRQGSKWSTNRSSNSSIITATDDAASQTGAGVGGALMGSQPDTPNSRQSHLYSTLWLPPTSEPITIRGHPGTGAGTRLHQQTNPHFAEDSSGEASPYTGLSPTFSRAQLKQLLFYYPQHFYDNVTSMTDLATPTTNPNPPTNHRNTLHSNSKKRISERNLYVNLLADQDDVKLFRHMDSEVDLRGVGDKPRSRNKHHLARLCDTHLPLEKNCSNRQLNERVPDSGDDQKQQTLLALQPLMERSCEDDNWRRDSVKLSLDFVNF